MRVSSAGRQIFFKDFLQENPDEKKYPKNPVDLPARAFKFCLFACWASLVLQVV